MKLKKLLSVSLKPTSPFHFDGTFYKPDHFPSPDNAWEPGTRWQTCRWKGQSIGLRFDDAGTLKSPAVRVTIFGRRRPTPAFTTSLMKEIEYRFNLKLELKPFYRIARDDLPLSAAVKRLNGMRPGHPNSLYEYLIIGTLLQNAPVRRSIQMMKALLERYGEKLEFDGKMLLAFWRPGALKAITEEELRALSLGYRAKTIKRLDAEFEQNSVDEFSLREAPYEEQRKALLSIYGVGPATAWYLLFDIFHRYDFFDHISPWEQKIYTKLLLGRSPHSPAPVGTLLKRINRYGEYRQLAIHYLWENLWWAYHRGEEAWLAELIKR